MKAFLASVLLAPLAAGCSSLSNTGEAMWTWQKPELLYLLDRPCDRLYVEVDTIEGIQPPADCLAGLEQVLRGHCNKSVIQIVCGKPIPLDKARGKPPRFLALENIDGPPATEAPDRTAYLYVLFYDSNRLGFREADNPNEDRYYPCAIYFDMAYWPRVARQVRRQMITHELGHVLGVCKNTSHGDGLHCRRPDCVMAPLLRVPLETLLLGLPPPAGLQATFCRQCRQDLQAVRTELPESRLSFCGPVLVRQENGYRVSFLPGCVKLSFDPDEKPDWRELLAKLRPLAEQHSRKLQGETSFLYLRDAPKALRGKELVVARAAKDPNPVVAKVAADLLELLTTDVIANSPLPPPATGQGASAHSAPPDSAGFRSARRNSSP